MDTTDKGSKVRSPEPSSTRPVHFAHLAHQKNYNSFLCSGNWNISYKTLTNTATLPVNTKTRSRSRGGKKLAILAHSCQSTLFSLWISYHACLRWVTDMQIVKPGKILELAEVKRYGIQTFQQHYLLSTSIYICVYKLCTNINITLGGFYNKRSVWIVLIALWVVIVTFPGRIV